MRAFSIVVVLAIVFPVAERSVRMSTWSVVAADPASGDVGVAGASCIPNLPIDAIAALVPGKGAAATQALWELDKRNKVFELLQAGDAADEIVRKVTSPSYDNAFRDRQYGVVTIANGVAKAVTFTGQAALAWAGAQQDMARAVTVQGNILVGPAVVADALRAFQSSDASGANALPDRLMRALEAGSAAGGDLRCNSPNVRQTASSAFLLVAQNANPPYAAREIGISDQGSSRAPWLAISVAERQFGPNPVAELRRRYDSWKRSRGDADSKRSGSVH